ncbi:MarR family winged helix-turn-helix transcriptional regulator [Kaistia algarum]|jgi:DNA-binding MarR family transcriptional regulator|uniref:MarR family winged helix-turn-helix transcriptional regulator n=1 Tax=Kaistia algarum TaxID=2083279 RepID=UPI0022537D8E|nr:MarR family transcriptional regulator [Kaistia algarum]MCX5513116.1 MarR family transcriptional regulator [Kaistia algarum]
MASNEADAATVEASERENEADVWRSIDLASMSAALYEASGYDLGEHPAHLIRKAHQRATMRFQEVMGEHDLTPTQMAALATIMKHGELSQNQLGRLTAMDPSTISIVIRKLLKHGLVQRFASAEDQRLTIIRLTEHGVRYAAPLLATSVEVGRRVLAPLKPSERAMFMEMLHRVADGEDVASGD